MASSDLDIVLTLRNHPEIRRYMLTRHEISTAEHAQWFRRASKNRAIKLLIFEVDGICSGFVQFKETLHPQVVEWGFYAAPNAPKGTGRKLGLAAIQYAFESENLHKICGQALSWNHPSVEFHRSLGFAQEGVLRDQHFDGTTYHDLICFGLLKHEWAAGDLAAGNVQ